MLAGLPSIVRSRVLRAKRRAPRYRNRIIRNYFSIQAGETRGTWPFYRRVVTLSGFTVPLIKGGRGFGGQKGTKNVVSPPVSQPRVSSSLHRSIDLPSSGPGIFTANFRIL